MKQARKNDTTKRKHTVQKCAIALLFTGAAISASGAFSGDTNYQYDGLGRVIKVSYPDGSQINYQYDLAGNRTQVIRAVTGGGTNHAPVCTNKTNTMTGIPYSVTATVTLTSAIVLVQCTDADGDAMTVATPTVPYTFTVVASQTVNIAFSVSDGHGGTGSGTLTYTRP